MEVLGFLLVAPAAAIGAFVAIDCRDGASRFCPACRRWWAREVVEEVLLERKKCFGLVTRHGATYSSGSYSGSDYSSGGARAGHHSGTTGGSAYTSWQELVPVIRSTFEVHFHCRFCEVYLISGFRGE